MATKLQELRAAVKECTDKPARLAAQAAAKQARADAVATLQAIRKEARERLDATVGRTAAWLEERKRVINARLALQLYLETTGKPRAEQANRKHARADKVDFPTPSPEQHTRAAATVCPMVTRLRELQAVVVTATDHPARRTARQAAKQARIETVGALQSARKHARDDYNAAAGDEIQQQERLATLVDTRLALQIFHQQMKQMRSPSTTKGGETCEEQTAHVEQPQDALAVVAPVSNEPNRWEVPQEMALAAETAIDQADAVLVPLREAAASAEGKMAKKEARQALKKATVETMATLQRTRADARAAVDAAEGKAAKRELRPAVQHARAKIQAFKKRMQTNGN
jgi:hypothetical protein